MKKVFSILALILFFSTQCFGASGIYYGRHPIQESGDGFIGNNDTSATNTQSVPTADDKAIGGVFQVTTAGTVSYVHVKISAMSGGNCNVAIINEDIAATIADGTITSITESSGVVHFPLDSSVVLSSSVNYRLVFGTSSGDTYWNIFHDTQSGKEWARDSAYPVANDMPSTFNEDVLYSNASAIIWATNTADGS